MTNVVRLDDFRAQKIPTAASAAVGDHDEEVADEELWSISFAGTPDEIHAAVIEWLSKYARIGEIVTVRRGSLEFGEEPDDWRTRDPDDDVVWQESLPMFDEDDEYGEPIGMFGAETFLGLVKKHEASFKALLASEDWNGGPDADAFLSAFYRY